jgi:hypothetical protein
MGVTGRRGEHPVLPDETCVLFDPHDIYSKFGFGDGDMLDPVVADWARERGFDVDGEDWRLLSPHRLLWFAYHRFVARPEWEPVLFAHTSHNPVRAVSEWEGLGGPGLPDDVEPVLVPLQRLRDLCAELFPSRPTVWKQLHHALHDAWMFKLPDHPAFAGVEADAEPGLTPELSGHVLATDALCAFYGLSDDEMVLLARLLRQQDREEMRAASGARSEDEGVRVAPFDVLGDLVRVCRLALKLEDVPAR